MGPAGRAAGVGGGVPRGRACVGAAIPYVNCMVKPHGQTAAAPADDETPQRILLAAHEVFLEMGTARATTQAIADRAGVNKALLHYYFGTKAELARVILSRAHAELWPAILGIMADPARPLEQKLRDVVAFEIDFLRARPYLPRFVAAELHTSPEFVLDQFAQRGGAPLALIQAQLDAEAAAGRIRPLVAGQLLVTVISSIVFPFVARPVLEATGIAGPLGFDAFLDERKAFLTDFLLAAIRP